MDITTIAKSDIFFLIASISTVIVSLLIAVALVQLIRVLKTIQKVSNTALKEGESIALDLQSLRQSIKEKGKTISSLAALSAVFAGLSKVKSKVNKTKK